MTQARYLRTAAGMLQQHSESYYLDRAPFALAQDAALGYQLAEFALGLGELETAEHFQQLASEAEQQLMQRAVHLAD